MAGLQDGVGLGLAGGELDDAPLLLPEPVGVALGVGHGGSTAIVRVIVVLVGL